MPPKIKTSVGMETADETVARARKMLEPKVSANELVNPPAPVNPPVPEMSTNDGSRTTGLIGNVATQTEGFIQAQTEEAAKAKELAGLLGTQTFDGAGERARMGQEYGLPDNLSRLKDIQTQLAQRNTEKATKKSQIQNAAGQTQGQAQRELSQADREAAIRDAGLAAEAAVLQGNIETASSLIKDAMTDYYADRQLKNQNILNQLEYYKGVADDQTKQLIDREQRKYEEDQRQIVRAEAAVDAAMTSGYASASDMQKLTSLAGDPAAQTAYAQTIVANAARQAAAIERQSQAGLDLERRSQLYELAAMGDPAAIAELGFDPTAPLTEAANKKIDAQIDEATKAEQKITDLLSNKIGLQSASGEWQFGEATLKGLVGQGTNETSTIGGISVNSSPFGLSGIAKSRQQKATFLANADQLLTKEGLLEIGDLAAQDIKLTPITERELAILFQSASTLNAAARRDDSGKLIGFSIPDYEVEKEFQNMLLSYTTVKAELAAQKNLGSGAYAELQALSQQPQ